MSPAILIHGPTASGKTELAVALAERLDGEVINADSMQVYSGLRVLTARPTEEEMGGIAHHLFGEIDPGERFSTGAWLEAAKRKLAAVERRGKRAIFVGGTGLYLLALVQGLSDIPPVPEDVRQEVKEILRSEGVDGLARRVAAVDPASGERLEPGDRQRLARALEVWLATGKTISSFQNARAKPALGDGEWLGIALTPPRARLYRRIDRRFSSMMIEGAMEEARALVERDLDPELPAMKAHGMPWLAAYIRGEISADEAAENAKRDTRRYAKRQFTWIARQFPFWPRIPSMELDKRKRIILALYKDVDAASR